MGFWTWLSNLFAPRANVPEIPDSSADKNKPKEVPVEKPITFESTCPAPGVFGAVDLSQPCTQHFLDVMKYLGVKTVIRYYDQEHETMKGKTPKADELALIKKNDFSVCMVFQHSNNRVESFTVTRGKADATRSVELAHQWGQPKGSGIFFGVDFDPGLGTEMDAVKRYAEEFSKVARAAGYRVGAYGSGLTLETLLAAVHIDLAWLSMSTGFRHSKDFAESKRWHLKQTLDRDCGGINIDFDYVNDKFPNFGQWKIP